MSDSQVTDATAAALSLDTAWARWRRRYIWHLDQVPQLFAALDADVVPLGAFQYDREKVAVSRDGAPVPFRVDVVDARDDLWAALLQYAENVAELLYDPLPVVPRWRVGSEVAGVRVGEAARRHSFVIVSWLIERVEAILPLTVLGDTEDYLFTMIRADSKRFLEPRPEPSRKCRMCGARRVAIRWTRTGMVSDCAECHDSRRLDVSRPVSEKCEWGAHDRCDTVSCLCSCHDRRSSLLTVRIPPREALTLAPRPPMSATCSHDAERFRDDDGGVWRCGDCGVVLGGAGIGG